MTDKAYPEWEPKQRLEIARNQFIQGVESASIQLVLMREKPTTVEAALELAQRQLAVETAQKRLHRHPEQRVHSVAEDGAEANALSRSGVSTSGSELLEGLSKQVQRLSEQLSRLQANCERPKPPPRRVPICWSCNERGHVRRDCPRRRPSAGERQRNRPGKFPSPFPSGSMATEAAIAVEGCIGKRPTKLLVDTGSAVTILREDVWKEAVDIRNLEPPLSPVVAANGEQLEICGRSKVSLQVGSTHACYPVLVARNITQECLLGADFLEDFGCIINLRERTLMIGETPVPLQFRKGLLASTCHVSCAETTVVPGRHQLELPVQLCQSKEEAGEFVGILEPEMLFMERRGVLIARSVHSISAGKERSLVRILNPSPAPVTIHQNEKLGVLQPLEAALESATIEEAEPKSSRGEVEKAVRQLQAQTQGLSEAENAALEALLFKFSDIISLHSHDLGKTSIVRHNINTGGAMPIKQAPRRLPYHQRELVRKLLDEMIQQKIVEPASGPWSSPIVLVSKKDGSPRFCVDYRRINSLTRKDAHPLPRIDDTLDALSGAKWFSTIDLASGYWQVEVEPSDREKTAFATPFGLHQFRVMPFGLCNAPSTFQRLMELVLAGLHWSTCLVYLDDIIIYSRTIDDHLKHLQEVLERLRAAGLKLKPSKCYLLQKSVHYLGHIISEHGVATDPQKTHCVKQWPIPMCVAELRQFLGLATYYRKFVRNFAQVASPLYRLTERNKTWTWNEECEVAFCTLKERLTSAPILAFPNFTQPFILDADASTYGLGAVLAQTIDGKEQVVAYASRTLTKAERRYCATRREMLAMVWAVRYFRPYLYGRLFTARTDHNSLKWLQNFRDTEGQLARWLEILAEYQFTVEHRPGKRHGNADALSRTPCTQCGRQEEPGEDSVETITVADASPPQGDSVESITVAASCPPQGSNPSQGDNHELRSWAPAWSPEEVESFQRADPSLGPVLQWLASDSIPTTFPRDSSHGVQTLWAQRQQLILKEGILYRKWEDVPRKGHSQHLQLVLPHELVPTVLEALHNHSTAGHLGITKTLQKVRYRFYWPGQRRDIEDWCRACDDCASRKHPPKPHCAPLQSDLHGIPLQRVAMDILGPLPETERGHKYVLVIADYFTKWTEAFPMPNMEAHTVANLFVYHFICRFGAPDYLHTDQGRNFESALMSEVCKLLGVSKTRTSPYHPQSDGLVERFNRTLLNMLSVVAKDNEHDWDLQVPLVMMAYRTSVQESTGATPFSLMFGREARLPIDVIFGPPPGEKPASPSQYALLLRQRLEAAYHCVRTQLSLQQRRQKTLYDQKASGAPYCVRDLVWLHCPAVARGHSRKFHRPWQGPYNVVKVITDVLYRIQQVKHPRRRVVVHYNRLKAYQGRLNKTFNESPSLSPAPIHRSDPAPQPDSDIDEPVIILQPPSRQQIPEEPPLRRSSRLRRPPDWYGDTVSY